MNKRILIADDHDLVRDTLAEYLRGKANFDVVSASSLDEALSVLDHEPPFCLVLLDYSMPGMVSLTGLERVKRKAKCPVAIISGTATVSVGRQALSLGAAGFLPKTLEPVMLLEAIQDILHGKVFVPEGLFDDEEQDEHNIDLTPRELDVLVGICEGKSNKEIARDLDVQEVTIKLHVKTMTRKLGARNRTHAAMIGRTRGLV